MASNSKHQFATTQEEAFAALREAIMMAQEANDQACLQHALAWLYRLQPENRPDRMALIERCIAKCSDTEMSYLTSLGIQTLSQTAAVSGRYPPRDVIEILGRSDVLNCQHSIIGENTAFQADLAGFIQSLVRTPSSLLGYQWQGALSEKKCYC